MCGAGGGGITAPVLQPSCPAVPRSRRSQVNLGGRREPRERARPVQRRGALFLVGQRRSGGGEGGSLAGRSASAAGVEARRRLVRPTATGRRGRALAPGAR